MNYDDNGCVYANLCPVFIVVISATLLFIITGMHLLWSTTVLNFDGEMVEREVIVRNNMGLNEMQTYF